MRKYDKKELSGVITGFNASSFKLWLIIKKMWKMRFVSSYKGFLK